MTEAKDAAFVCMSECKGALLRQLRLRAAVAVARSLRHSYEGERLRGRMSRVAKF